MLSSALRLPPVPRRRLLAAGAALALIGPAACATRPGAGATRPFQLAISDTAQPPRYIALDAQTLGDPAGRPSLPVRSWAWVYSADGSTLVEIAQFEPQTTIMVRDGHTLVERGRFAMPEPVVGFPLRLSADGSRLVLEGNTGQTRRPQTWYVLDTVNGRRLTTVTATETSAAADWWVDPAARRLLRPVMGSGSEATAPRPLRFAAYDLTTGGVAGRLELPGVLAGFWQDGSGSPDDPVVHQRYPAMAPTPDGSRLAVFQPERALLTLVDAARLRIERSVALSPAPSLPAALRALLPFLPEVAEAKAMDGTSLRGVMGPDGHNLYVWGDVNQFADGRTVARPFGLKRIDVQRGIIAAEALPDVDLFAVAPAPDGRGIYVYGTEASTNTSSPDWPGFLRRLDATTLAVTAERQFSGFRYVILRPA